MANLSEVTQTCWSPHESHPTVPVRCYALLRPKRQTVTATCTYVYLTLPRGVLLAIASGEASDHHIRHAPPHAARTDKQSERWQLDELAAATGASSISRGGRQTTPTTSPRHPALYRSLRQRLQQLRGLRVQGALRTGDSLAASHRAVRSGGMCALALPSSPLAVTTSAYRSVYCSPLASCV